tara:strand:+ start:49 stop:483 length:435 start_codon:yes stop_codon:yes gene_type:complete
MDGSARLLGYSGLLPQIAAIGTMLTGGPELYWTAMAVAYGYAAFIFSFLGGVWWGLGLAIAQPPRWIFVAAVMPSLIALATYLPWVLGWDWPRPSLMILAVALIASPLVDRLIVRGRAGFGGWLKLRWHLSIGLGGLTLLAGLL